MVMVTHDNRILEMTDRIVMLEDGRIVHDTAPVCDLPPSSAVA